MIEPAYRLLIALDIEGFGKPSRTNLTRLALRRRLRRMYVRLLRQIGVTPERFVSQDTGDGAILSIDGAVPKSRILDRLVPTMADRLVATNDGKPPSQQMRLRMALHAGDTLADPEPLHGEAVIFTSRLLDAAPLRSSLAATTMPLALIVSPVIYEETVKHGYGRIDPSTFHPTVAHVKETRTAAWLHVPGDPLAPQRAEAGRFADAGSDSSFLLADLSPAHLPGASAYQMSGDKRQP